MPVKQVRHVVIAGYGLPGRSIAEYLTSRRISHAIIERNPITVTRCQVGGTKIIAGDARDADILRRAGIMHATELAVAIPDEVAVLDVVEQARRLNKSVRIIARCSYISGGMEATRRGADQVIVAEQVVAAEFMREIQSGEKG
jgi:CPA2 family monovalent cation:H+ antiporter-2